ncbi:MAG: bifunctional adenosylcobinamide kinase/adenosylcobinamide-phosphate guanylyltransferase [Proteobacteria bacterium]|nr:bifunctional adenosylcobinamide kinase/adenosylcobinamide-phosphate guanylyltransferase [Pseudomonadota bacterium]MBU1742011.1 bifunctional adenosylcobinamide kinase/adenosylcobinamide-phosphate guanylyltransferase [Pseudomonadota bacterium]
MIHLVLGGAKSGKSDLALAEAERLSAERVFVATAEALDEEMAARVAAHQERRGPDWRTVEEPLGLADRLRQIDGPGRVVVVDCVTLWLSNLLTRAGLDAAAALERVQELASLLSRLEADLIVVSNEVGSGVVPADELGRAWRDLAGRANQILATAADRVTLVVAGLPLDLK